MSLANLFRTLCCLTLITGLAANARADEWNRFRGPNGSGVSDTQTVPTEWTKGDFNWRFKLPGTGHASPVVWGDRLFLLSGDDESGSRIVSCVEAESGQVVWSRKFEAATHRRHRLNSLASSTPTVDGERVYVSWATPDEYIVAALSHDGEPQWRVDLGGYRSGHGFGVSPVLFDDLLIVSNEQEGESTLVALDRRSGERRWTVERDTQSAWSTPCIFAPAGRAPELIFTNWKQGITAIRAATGQPSWEVSVFDLEHSESAIASPIVVGDVVFGTCGYLGYATHTVAVRPNSAVDDGVTEVFRVDRGAPLTTTPLVAHGLLFLWADTGIVTCVDAKTGELQWRERVGGTYYASPVVAGDAIYCASTSGEMVVLECSREFRELSRSPILDGSHSSPAIAHGRMYVRTFSHLISIGDE